MSKRTTNIVALVVGAVLIAGIGVNMGYLAIVKNSMEKNAKLQLEDLANNFSDMDVIDRWSKGEVVDPWGNVIISSNQDRKLILVSCGADGELGTQDDITCEVKLGFVDGFVKDIEAPKKTEESEATESQSFLDKAKNLFKKSNK